MKIIDTSLQDAKIIEQPLHLDERGFFLELYNVDNKLPFGANTFCGVKEVYPSHASHVPLEKNVPASYLEDSYFVQDNLSFSRDKGTIRGFHFQTHPFSQAKLVACLHGSVMDVIVDLRPDSPTFRKYEIFLLSASRPNRLLLVPKGFAHAFCTLEINSTVFYKIDAPYNPQAESGIIWNDPTLNILWPTHNPILSEKDKTLPTLTFYLDSLTNSSTL